MRGTREAYILCSRSREIKNWVVVELLHGDDAVDDVAGFSVVCRVAVACEKRMCWRWRICARTAPATCGAARGAANHAEITRCRRACGLCRPIGLVKSLPRDRGYRSSPVAQENPSARIALNNCRPARFAVACVRADRARPRHRHSLAVRTRSPLCM